MGSASFHVLLHPCSLQILVVECAGLCLSSGALHSVLVCCACCRLFFGPGFYPWTPLQGALLCLVILLHFSYSPSWGMCGAQHPCVVMTMHRPRRAAADTANGSLSALEIPPQCNCSNSVHRRGLPFKDLPRCIFEEAWTRLRPSLVGWLKTLVLHGPGVERAAPVDVPH